jgi:hypothetical protein
MKKLIIVALLITLIPTTAHAEETGAWVAVDANGNAISQAIVCTPSVCGNTQTPFMGQHWVLQAPASADGNVAGVGAGQGMDSVKVDLQTGVWTTTQSNKYIDPLTQKPVVSVSVQQFTSDTAPWVSKPFVPTQSALIAQQEATIADLYAQMAKLKNAKKVKKAKK